MNYKKRKLEASVSEIFDIFPIATITGPRQSGKTTFFPIEVKSAIHIRPQSIRGLQNFRESQKDPNVPFSIVLYRGEELIFINKYTLGVPLGLLY
jgi:predicted AAA+ superfamily ATPase